MAFLALMASKPDGDTIRERVRAEHIEYVLANEHHILYGGALTNDEGTSVTGVLMVLDFDKRQDAETFINNEPYNRAGMFSDVRIEAFSQRTPQPSPGFLQRELELEREKRRQT